jgi:Ala-tRNA(Pro) deacylase
MAILNRLKEFLDGHGVEYIVSTHRPTFTATDAADAEHVPLREHAKAVVVMAGDRPVVAVLRASDKLDLHKLPVRGARLASETEFEHLFPGCELGAMPPLGTLFGLPVYVDRRLVGDEWINFLAGNHTQSIRMRYIDFERLVQPMLDDYVLTPSEAC